MILLGEFKLFIDPTMWREMSGLFKQSAEDYRQYVIEKTCQILQYWYKKTGDVYPTRYSSALMSQTLFSIESCKETADFGESYEAEGCR